MNVNFSSGRPGQGGSFNIRGVNSISADAAPLTIIDGIEGDINKVNPNDVESIIVLKDASAAAVYGARAAYGVILVTTKNGKVGKTNVSYNGRFSFGETTTSTDFETRGYYSAGINDMFYKTYQGVPYTHYTQEDYHELWIRRNDKVEDPSRPWVVEKNGEYKYYGNFDWYNCLFDNTRPTWEHNLTVSGGTEKVKYMLSGNYYNQKGIIRIDPDRFKKYTFRSKIIANITSWFELSNNTSYYHSEYTYPGLSGVNDVFTRAGRHALASIVPMHPDGTLVYRTGLTDTGEVADGVSAVLLNGGHHNRDREYEFVTTFEAVLKPIKHFEIRANYSWAHYNQQNLNRSVDVLYSRNPGETITMDNGRTRGNYLSEIQNNQIRQTFNLYGTYDNTFANAHSVKVIVGGNYDYKYFKKLGMKRNGLLSESLDDFNLAKGDDISITGGQEEYAILGFFYRLNYGYKDRYLFEASGRYDGSSRFAPGNRWRMFPGVSASWRISQENFLKNSKVFNELKLRASYGQTGNQEGIRLYDYIQLLKFRDDGWGTKLIYPFGNGSQSQAMGLDVLAGVDRTWEILENVNVGVDAAFLDSRLGFSFDYFVKMNNNMLIPVTYPSMLGAEAPYSNSGKLRTNGFELTLNWTDKIGNVEYSAQFQLTDAVNKLVEYGGADTYKLGLNETREGYPMNSYFAYVYDGVIKDQADLDAYKKLEGVPSNIGIGDAKFKDLNGDGKISTYGDKDGDDGDAEYVGSTTPRYSFGLNLGAKWNNFDISVFFQGVAKRTLFREGDFAMPWSDWWRYPPQFYYGQTWNEDRPDAYYPRLTHGEIRHWNYQASTLQKINAAYIRLKNIQIGYTLPKGALQKLGIERTRFYVSGQDLFEIHNVKGGWDPESDKAGFNYPFQRYYSFGIDLTF